MRNLYKITISAILISLFLLLWIELLVEIICNNRWTAEVKNISNDRCYTLFSWVFNNWIIEFIQLLTGILVIFSISGIICDTGHYIIKKIKKN